MVRTLVLLALALPLPAADPTPVRLGSDRFRQANSVGALVYSPDGRQLASVDGDAVHVWDAADGRRRATVRLDRHQVHDLAFAPDGRTVFAVASDDTGYHLCRLDAGRTVRDHRPITPWGRGWTFGPGGRHLAFWDGDILARVLDTATGEAVVVSRLPGYHKGVDRFVSAAFRADGSAVAFGTDRGIVGVFDPATGKSLHQHQLEDSRIRSLAFAPDGKDLLVETHGGVERLDATTGRARWRHKGYMTRWPTVTADGTAVRYYGSAPDFAAPLFAWRHLDAATGKPLARMIHAGYGAFAIRPDGKVLAVGGADPERRRDDGLISLWDLTTGRRLAGAADPPELAAELRFSPDGSAVRGRAGGWYEWDVTTGKQSRLTPPIPAEWAAMTAVSDDQRWYARLVYRGDPEPRRVERIDLRTGEGRFLRTGEVEFNTIRFFGDGRLLVREKGGVATYDPASGDRRAWVPATKDAKFAASDDGTTAVLVRPAEGNGVRVEQWDLAAGRHVKTWRAGFPHPADVFPAFRRDAWLSADGRVLAVSFYDVPPREAYTCLLDTRTEKALSAWYDPEPVADVTFRPGNRTVAVRLDEGNKVYVREAATGYVRHEVPTTGRPTGCALSPDGRWLALGAGPTPVELHDLLAGPGGGATRPGSPAAAWVGLGGRSGEEVAAAFRDLRAHPAAAVRLLRERPPGPADPTAEWLAARIKALDAPRYRDRERATAELAEAGTWAVPALRAARATASPEVRERLTALLDRAGGPTPGDLRALRACELLEALGTPEARELLAAWARGPAATTLAREAVASVERLRARPTEVAKTDPPRWGADR